MGNNNIFVIEIGLVKDFQLKYTSRFSCVLIKHTLYFQSCYDRGQDIIVVPKTSESQESTWMGLAKYAWSGYVLECPNCGIIYRSRQYWYGNQDPEKSVVRTEIRHVWPGVGIITRTLANTGLVQGLIGIPFGDKLFVSVINSNTICQILEICIIHCIY